MEVKCAVSSLMQKLLQVLCRASEPAIKQEEGCDGQDSDDELDKLTAQFEQEAAQQKAAVVQAKGKGKPQAKSMSERREEGLAIPLDSDNRSAQCILLGVICKVQ